MTCGHAAANHSSRHGRETGRHLGAAEPKQPRIARPGQLPTAGSRLTAPFESLALHRGQRRSPGVAAVAVFPLAVGIGANTAIFSFVDGVLLKPLPYPDADRIVRILEKPPRGDRNGISTLNFLDWQTDNTVFDFMAAQS